MDEFVDTVNNTGLCVIGQTGNLTPADKKLYALRDVTATVDSIGLIASSVMSKKIAAGSDGIVLDVTTGSGAFMKETEDAKELARLMIKIGKNAGRKMAALVTDMDEPLGFAIGNSIEVIEAIETLKGNGPKDLVHVCVELAAAMLYLGDKGSIEECRELAKDAISSGKALGKLKEMVKAQGGDAGVIENTEYFQKASVAYEVKSDKNGYISKMDARQIGVCAMMLGAGRETKDSVIDLSAGIKLCKKTGDYVAAGETLAVFYTNNLEAVHKTEATFLEAFEYSMEAFDKRELIYCIIY